MSDDARTNAELVANIGRHLYGTDWAHAVAADLKMNPRTVQRIKRAAELGEAFPIAPGAMSDLVEIARARAAGLEGAARALEAFMRRAQPQVG
jgi:hypothetical protein